MVAVIVLVMLGVAVVLVLALRLALARACCLMMCVRGLSNGLMDVCVKMVVGSWRGACREGVADEVRRGVHEPVPGEARERRHGCAGRGGWGRRRAAVCVAYRTTEVKEDTVRRCRADCL